MVAGGPAAQPGRQAAAGTAALLAAPEASALAEVAPGLAGSPDAAFGGLDDRERRAFALQAAVRLIAAMAQPRCLIVADDLHWADPTSLTLLACCCAVWTASAWRPHTGQTLTMASTPPRHSDCRFPS